MSERLNSVLARRREALLAECAFQRHEVRDAIDSLLAPVHKPAGMLASLRERLGGKLAVPLALAGAVAALMVMRGRRAIPVLTAAAALWKLGGGLLNTLRQAGAASPPPDEPPL